MKIARSHLISVIECALDRSCPVTEHFRHYILEATPYRIPGKRGNHGVRVTWHERKKDEK